MTSILGIKIIDEDYQERVIKIAFNPMAKDDEERFAVQDQSHIKSSKWIEDISMLFKPEFSQLKFIRKYCEENDIPYSEYNGQKHEEILDTPRWLDLVQYQSAK